MNEAKNEAMGFAEVVREELEKLGMSFSCKVRKDETVFSLPIPVDNAPGIQVKLIIDDDGDCKLRSYLASSVSKARRTAMLEVLNDLNAKFRYICLSLDSDGDVCASYDFTLRSGTDSVFDQAAEMLFLFTDIADKCIPDIMRTIWSADDGIRTKLFEQEDEE